MKIKIKYLILLTAFVAATLGILSYTTIPPLIYTNLVQVSVISLIAIYALFLMSEDSESEYEKMIGIIEAKTFQSKLFNTQNIDISLSKEEREYLLSQKAKKVDRSKLVYANNFKGSKEELDKLNKIIAEESLNTDIKGHWDSDEFKK